MLVGLVLLCYQVKMIDNLTPTIIFNILPRGEFACWRVPSVGNVAKFRSLPIIVLDDFGNLQIEYLNQNKKDPLE